MNRQRGVQAQEEAARVVACVAGQIRQCFPAVRALILTGSAARDEATFMCTVRGSRWLSDVEFLVVVSDSTDLRRAAVELRGAAREIRCRLKEDGVDVVVDLIPAPRKYFRMVRPHLFGYELMRHGRQLFGDQDYLSQIPPFVAADIPLEDAWRLSSNRMVEWLAVLCGEATIPLAEQFHQLSKQYVDLLTSLSLFSGHYQATYWERVMALDHVAGWLVGTPLRVLIEQGFVEAARTATAFRLDPGAGTFEWIWKAPASGLRACLERLGWAWMYDRLRDMTIAAWCWKLSRLAGLPVVGREDALLALRRVYGWKDWLRGWGILVTRPHLRSGGTFLSRAPRLAGLGTPRGLVYVCAEQLLEHCGDDTHEGLRWVGQHLPLLYGQPRRSWQEMAHQCVRNWREYLQFSQA